MSVDHAAEARRLVDRVSGDLVEHATIPAPLAQLLEAQVHAMLAVADAITEASNVGAKAIYDGRL